MTVPRDAGGDRPPGRVEGVPREHTRCVPGRARPWARTWSSSTCGGPPTGASPSTTTPGCLTGRAICDLVWSDLPADVPTSPRRIDACGPMGVNVEVKSSARDPDFDPERTVAAEVASLVGRRDLYDRILVSSFDVGEHRAASARSIRRVATAWLTMVVPDSGRSRREPGRRGSPGAPPVRRDRRSTRSSTPAMTRASRSTCGPSTIPARMPTLAAIGVDGICTNVPDVALRRSGPRLTRSADRRVTACRARGGTEPVDLAEVVAVDLVRERRRAAITSNDVEVGAEVDRSRVAQGLAAHERGAGERPGPCRSVSGANGHRRRARGRAWPRARCRTAGCRGTCRGRCSCTIVK